MCCQLQFVCKCLLHSCCIEHAESQWCLLQIELPSYIQPVPASATAAQSATAICPCDGHENATNDATQQPMCTDSEMAVVPDQLDIGFNTLSKASRVAPPHTTLPQLMVIDGSHASLHHDTCGQDHAQHSIGANIHDSDRNNPCTGAHMLWEDDTQVAMAPKQQAQHDTHTGFAVLESTTWDRHTFTCCCKSGAAWHVARLFGVHVKAPPASPRLT